MTTKGQNPNHPKKGSSITVDPIRSLKDIRKIKRKLKKTGSRDLLLFSMGINNGLRVGDLLNLKVEDVIDLEPGETLKIREQKTGKQNVLMVNGEVHQALERFIEATNPKDEDPLFKSRKTGKALTVPYASQLVKSWCRDLKGNFGSHTLRKTFGYIQRTEFGVGFDVLCKRFGHSSPAITMRYLGIEDKEVNGILLNEI
jgi:integrase